MTIKTPEQIAEELLHDGVILNAEAIRDYAIAAIEADRAQRSAGAPDFPIDDALALGIPPVSRVFVENVTEEALTDEQFERVCRAVPHSSIPEALSVIVEGVLS